MPRAFLILVSFVAVVGMIFVGVISWQQESADSGPVVTTVGNQAFGSLTADTLVATPSRDSSAEASKLTTAGAPTTVAPEPFPEPIAVSYRYLPPATLPQLPANVDVLAWRKTTTPLDGFMNTTSSDIFDFSRVSGATAETIAFTTDDDYRVDVNLTDGSVSISQTAIDYLAMREANALTLDDTEAIAIARAFLDRFGISVVDYGQAIVQQSDVAVYDDAVRSVSNSGIELSTPPSDLKAYPYSMPVTVVYPLEIDSRPVVNTWGGFVGISVTIDPQTKTATSMYGARRLAFDSSAYATSTASQLHDDILNGGLSGYFPGEGAATDIQLGAAEEVYVLVYQYDQTTTRELLVPGYRFTVTSPVLNALAEIIVPLVPDLVETPKIEPLVDIEPAGTGSGGSAVNGSAGVETPEAQ